jgi:hypothetical protein
VKRIPPEQQTARLMTERRAKGKLVTVIAGLDPAGNDLTELATRLKNACLASRRPVPIGLQSILSTFVDHPAPGCSRQL